MTLFFLHHRFAQVGWILMLLLSAWAASYYFWKKALDLKFLSIVAVAEILMILQASIGTFIFLGLGLILRATSTGPMGAG